MNQTGLSFYCAKGCKNCKTNEQVLHLDEKCKWSKPKDYLSVVTRKVKNCSYGVKSLLNKLSVSCKAELGKNLRINC